MQDEVQPTVLMERATMTVEEAARVLGISRGKAYEAAALGQIPTLKIGRRILVPRVALERLLMQSRITE